MPPGVDASDSRGRDALGPESAWGIPFLPIFGLFLEPGGLPRRFGSPVLVLERRAAVKDSPDLRLAAGRGREPSLFLGLPRFFGRSAP